MLTPLQRAVNAQVEVILRVMPRVQPKPEYWRTRKAA
jgi:hypothetical protein